MTDKKRPDSTQEILSGAGALRKGKQTTSERLVSEAKALIGEETKQRDAPSTQQLVRDSAKIQRRKESTGGSKTAIILLVLLLIAAAAFYLMRAS